MKLPESRHLAPPLPGQVIRYAYLWTHEAAEGREEARKDRPCAVVIATAYAAGVPSVVVVPLTSRAPSTPEEVMERRFPWRLADAWVCKTSRAGRC